MANSKLTKALYTEISRLKLCNNSNSAIRFALEKSPFDEDEEAEKFDNMSSKDCSLVGRIYPQSNVYKKGTFRIQMTFTSSFPYNPPEVKFLTKIYHPNVGNNGEFCHDLLRKTALWGPQKTLIDIVVAISQRIDNPDLEFALDEKLAQQYVYNRQEFDEKASQWVKEYALDRD